MKNHVVIFEARGGTDKGEFGFRKDSKAIIDALKQRGWTAEIILGLRKQNATKVDHEVI